MSIPLGVCRGGISIYYAQVTTISLKGFTIKLQTIVRDEGTRDSKPSDNIFPNEFLGIHITDICQWFSFDPFSEVIYADQQISLISRCLRERSYNIQAPLSKRPRTGQRIKDPQVGGCSAQTSSIGGTSSHSLVLPFAYSATNSLV